MSQKPLTEEQRKATIATFEAEIWKEVEDKVRESVHLFAEQVVNVIEATKEATRLEMSAEVLRLSTALDVVERVILETSNDRRLIESVSRIIAEATK